MLPQRPLETSTDRPPGAASTDPAVREARQSVRGASSDVESSGPLANRFAGRFSGRRGAAAAAVAVASLYVLWLLWLACFEIPSGPLGLSNVRLRYGLLRWYEIDTGSPVSPSSRPWPGLPVAGGLGVGRVLWGGLLGSGVASVLLLIYAFRIADGLDRNLQPRRRCNNCGQILRGGFHNSPICPECGELPHRRRNPFWIR